MDFNAFVKSIVEPVLLSFRFLLKQNEKGFLKYDHRNIAIIISYDYNVSYEANMTLLFKESGLFYGYKQLDEFFYNRTTDISAIQIKDEEIMIKWLQKVEELLRDNLSSIINKRTG